MSLRIKIYETVDTFVDTARSQNASPTAVISITESFHLVRRALSAR
jgi:hypothetical protein